MSSFLVICETCHARLRVRSASVIGEIHACPKCGSMVQIEAPADWSPPDAAAQAIGEATPFEPAATPIAIPTVAPSASRWVLWSVGGVGLLMAGGLVVAALSGGSEDSVHPSPMTTNATTPVAAAEPAPTTPVAPDEQLPPTAELAIPTLPPDKVAAGDAELAASAASDEAITVGPTLPAALPTEEEPKPATPDARSTAASAGNSEKDAPAKFDPLDFDPMGLNLSAGSSELVRPARAEADAENEANGASVADISAATQPLPVTGSVRLGPRPSQLLRNRNVAEQLALEIHAIDLSEVPLSRLLEMFSDVADVPITLEPAALEMSGKSPNVPVTLHAENVTIGDLFKTALAQCDLVYEERAGQLVVVKSDADRRRSVSYQVSDLVGEDSADATRLAKMIERFVAPTTWQSSAGPGTIAVDGTTLRVEQSQRVQYQILVFCERLRLARGLATRSRYPADRLSIEPLYPHLAARLSAKTTFNFLPWSRLADVLRHWESATGITMLVDWPALADSDLGPSSLVACAATDSPWNEAMDAVLAPLGLTWRAIDAETIQITSRTAGGVPQIEFYAVSDRLVSEYASPEALVAGLAEEAQKQVAGGLPVEMQLDRPSQRLVVLAPPEVHRYLSQRLAAD